MTLKQETIELIEKKPIHSKSIDFIEGYLTAAEELLTDPAILASVKGEEWVDVEELKRRVGMIKSEPDGIVRETMIDNLLLPTPPKTK